MRPIKLILLCFFAGIFFITCKKPEVNSGSPLEKFFEGNVLNKNITVNFASDNGVDITADYSGYIFILEKTDYYHGPLRATKNGVTYTGSWSSNEDYGKLIISLPSLPSEFIFLSRSWRFTSKSTTLMKLAPYGSSDPAILYMELQ